MSKARYIICADKIKVTANLKAELLEYFTREQRYA